MKTKTRKKKSPSARKRSVVVETKPEIVEESFVGTGCTADFPNEGSTETLDQETEEVKEQLDDSDDDPDINKTVA